MASTTYSAAAAAAAADAAARAAATGYAEDMMPPLRQNLSVVKTYAGKNVFLTGATGFVGKVILEKMLRSLGEVNKVYVLVRPRKGQDPQQRLNEEILGSEIFGPLRKVRKNFDEWANSKLQAIPGELTQPHVGLSEQHRALLKANLHIIIHCAAVVDFNERLDRALELNTLGSLRMLDLAKQCPQLGSFVHVSTCYVNSNQPSGNWVEEKAYPLGFDVNAMVERIKKTSASELDSIVSTGILGTWPNTYTFTKAITEHLLIENRGSVPMVIVRPSIVGSAYSEPYPGWVDVISAMGAVMLAVGMGVVRFLQGRPDGIGDIIPVDYVSNAILVASAAIYKQDRYFVCHAASSSENPMPWGMPVSVIKEFFVRYPPPRAIAKARFRFYRSPQMYQLAFLLQYSVPSAVLNSLALFDLGVSKETAAQFQKLLWQVRVVIEAFKHFVQNEWFFDNRNTRAIYQMLVPEEKPMFHLDLTDVHWVRYSDLFAYGLTHYTLKTNLIPADQRDYRHINITAETDYLQKQSITTAIMPDIEAIYNAFQDRWTKTAFPKAKSIPDTIADVLSSPEVLAAIADEAKMIASRPAGKKVAALTPEQSAQQRAKQIVSNMFGESNERVLASMGWFFRKVWRRIYRGVHVALENLGEVQALARKGPLIFIPTHRSYVDFLVVSYIALVMNLPIPFIAAGEDFLGIFFVRWLFRNSGAFFIRRTFAADKLYSAILQKYAELLLAQGQSLEFFIEGTRSRTGKMLHPKMGFLTMLLNVLDKGVVRDLHLVPVTINYEKTMEGNMYANELSGARKVKESLSALIKARNVLNANFGSTSVVYGKPISVAQWRDQHVREMNAADGMARITSALTRQRDIVLQEAHFATSSLPRIRLPDTTVASSMPGAECNPSTSAAAAAASSAVVEKPASAMASATYDIVGNAGHRKYMIRSLAYNIVHELAMGIECMPTHLVATLMLQYRHGISRPQLLAKFEWMRRAILQRGGFVFGCELESYERLVDNALAHLGDVVNNQRAQVYEPALAARHEYTNMLVLGQYKNRLVHYFYREALWCVAIYSLAQQQAEVSAASASAAAASSSSSSSAAAAASAALSSSVSAVLQQVEFLHALLESEFVLKANPDEPEDHRATLQYMVSNGVLALSEDGTRVEVVATGETHFSFLCALLWPFIDSFYTATLMLYSLQPLRSMRRDQMVAQAQWLGTTLYHESMLSFFESCSKETLDNAFAVLKTIGVMRVAKGPARKAGPLAGPGAGAGAAAAAGEASPSSEYMELAPMFQSEAALEALVERISLLRKQPPVAKKGSRRTLIADIPILAKLSTSAKL